MLVERRFLVEGALRAWQYPVGEFAGAVLDIDVLSATVTITVLADATPEAIRAVALAEAGAIVAQDCDSWEWRGRPLVVPVPLRAPIEIEV